MDIIETNPILSQLIELFCLGFETMEFKVLTIHSDPDCFSLKVIHLDNNQSGKNAFRIESLLLGSLEIFSRILMDPDKFHSSSSYFLNLHPQQFLSKFYNVEIHYLNTIHDAVFLEAYCYDENEVLIAKGGSLMLKE